MPSPTTNITSSRVEVPTLKEYSLKNLTEFFTRYEAYKADPSVIRPTQWHRLFDPPLLAALQLVTGIKTISNESELAEFKKKLIELDAPSSSFDLHTELSVIHMEHDMSITSFINYVTTFKAVVSRAPGLGA
ncbi:hypothetical protein ADUPG1_007857, partial [Aduncisulcus paluster]